MSSVEEKGNRAALFAWLLFASFCPLKILLKFQEGQFYVPSGWDFAGLLSNLSFIGKAL